jgi:hypothetical protein
MTRMDSDLWRTRIGQVVVRSIPPYAVRAGAAFLCIALISPLGAQVREPQQLPGVRIDATIKNQVGGVVLDRKDVPIPGARVEFIGLDRRVMTDSAGRFDLLDLKPGLYLLQFSKTGYKVAQRSIRMTERLDREVAVRLDPIGRDRYTAEVAAIVAKEADSRLGLRSLEGIVIGRDELEKFGKTRLDEALKFSSGRNAYLKTSTECLLINGHELATNGSAKDPRVSRGPRGLSVNMGSGPPGPPKPSAPPPPSWIRHFRANEVEMVELYPQETDASRTLCQRFPTSSGCSCPPEASGVVIWLR